MLGKRFQRTTSMAQIGGPAWSIAPAAAAPEPPQPQPPICQWEILKQAEEMMMKMMAAATGAGSGSRRAAGSTSSTVPDHSTAAPWLPDAEFLPRGTFLDNCFYCKRRLKHERDIFIYRGDAAFCTEECRQRHMLNDERSMTASKKGSSASETAVAA